MTTDWIFGWWNLIFIAPFALAVIYLGVYAVSGLTFGDADADHDFEQDLDADSDTDLGGDAHGDLYADLHADTDANADVNTDHDVDFDAEMDHDIDADHDLDPNHDADHDTDAEEETSPIMAALTWLGVGQVPVSIVLMVLLLTWGAIGFIVNVIAQPHVSQGWQAAIFSLPLALLGSLAITSGVSGLIVRYLPLHETSARRRHELLGCVGEAIFNLDQTGGLVAVRDEDGNLFQVACRTVPGAEPIPKGSRVRLVTYRAAGNLFFGTAAADQAASTMRTSEQK
jgi:membrane protein implicated in regulation of membrane protease activity